MKLFSLFFTSLLLLTSQLMATADVKEESNISVKTFNINNKQELFNSLKRVFYSAQHDIILDTNWTALHMSKRVITGFVDIDVEVQSVVLSSKGLDKNGTRELSLEIYSTQNDEVTSFKPDSFLHRLFWNRLEYILGLEDDWLECNYTLEAIAYRKHILCDVDRARPQDDIEAKKGREP